MSRTARTRPSIVRTVTVLGRGSTASGPSNTVWIEPTVPESRTNANWSILETALAWRRRQAPQPSEAEQAQRQDQLQTRRRQLQVLVQRTRAGLQQLYGSPLDPARQQAGKAALMAELQRDYAALRDGDWGGDARWDAWVAGLNNAALALQASYTDLVPQFERLFQRLDGDWPRFHAEVRRLATLPQARRRLELGPN